MKILKNTKKRHLEESIKSAEVAVLRVKALPATLNAVRPEPRAP